MDEKQGFRLDWRADGGNADKDEWRYHYYPAHGCESNNYCPLGGNLDSITPDSGFIKHFAACQGFYCPPSPPPSAPPPAPPPPPRTPCVAKVVTMYNPSKQWSGFNVSLDGATNSLGEHDGARDAFTVSFCTWPGCYPFVIGEGAFHGLEWKVTDGLTEKVLMEGVGPIMDGNLLCDRVPYPSPSPPPTPPHPPTLPPPTLPPLAPGLVNSPPPPEAPPPPSIPPPSPPAPPSTPPPPTWPPFSPRPTPPPPSTPPPPPNVPLPPDAPPNPPSAPCEWTFDLENLSDRDPPATCTVYSDDAAACGRAYMVLSRASHAYAPCYHLEEWGACPTRGREPRAPRRRSRRRRRRRRRPARPRPSGRRRRRRRRARAYTKECCEAGNGRPAKCCYYRDGMPKPTMPCCASCNNKETDTCAV